MFGLTLVSWEIKTPLKVFFVTGQLGSGKFVGLGSSIGIHSRTGTLNRLPGKSTKIQHPRRVILPSNWL